MKKQSIYFLLALFLWAACEPNQDSAPEIGPKPKANFSFDTTDPNNIEFQITENDGFMVNWDFGNSQKSQSLSPVVYYPFAGDYQVSLTVSGKGGATTVSKTLSITQSDPAICSDATLRMLTGGCDAAEGKTWVYATDHPSGTYFYMTATYDWEEYWWSPIHDDGETLAGQANEMHFDIDGGYHYALRADADAQAQQGGFVLDTHAMTLTVVDVPLPDYDNPNFNPAVIPTGVYQIKELTDNEMVLWQIQYDDDYAWAWRFKRKGYTYSK